MPTKTKTRTGRLDGLAPGDVGWLSVVKGWDWRIAIVLGVIAAALEANGILEVPRGLLQASVVIPLTLTGIVWAVERWLSDMVHGEDDYGDVIGSLDPHSDALSWPYKIVEMVGVVAFVVTLLAILILDDLSSGWRAVAIGIVTFLLTWTVAGFVELMVITRFHTKQRNRLRNLRRQFEREQRASKRSKMQDGGRP